MTVKTFVEVEIKSSCSDEELISAIRCFAQEVQGWQYLEKQSKIYAEEVGEASCALLRENNNYHPAIAITKSSANRFYMANNIPRDASRIPLDDYNALSLEWAESFRRYAKSHNLRLTVASTSGIVGLKGIISSKHSSSLFQRYLNIFPASYHPCDIKRLDQFICAFFRYSRKPPDMDLLKAWLINGKSWSPQDAEWSVRRIETGLAVLKVQRGS